MIAAVSCSVGVVALVIGWHGRRVNDHPICRRCRFDLFGLDRTVKQKCPECGSDVSQSGQVVIGQRAKHKFTVIIALGILTVAAALTAVNLVPIVRSLDWIQVRPAAWLLSDARGNNAADETAAVSELARRIKVGKLSVKYFDEIVEMALAKQAVRSKPFAVPYGEVLDEALMSGQLDEEGKQEFLRQILAPTLEIIDDSLDLLENGEAFDGRRLLSLVLNTGEMRIAYSEDLGLILNFVGYAVDGGEFVPASGSEVKGTFFMPFPGMSSRMTIAQQRVALELGAHEIKSYWELKLRDVVSQNDVDQRSTITVATVKLEFVSAVLIEADAGLEVESGN